MTGTREPRQPRNDALPGAEVRSTAESPQADTLGASARMVAQRRQLAALFGGRAVVQRQLMDADEFEARTTFNRSWLPWDTARPRKTIAAVDTALRQARAALDADAADATAKVEALVSAIDTYLDNHTREDPTNERIDPTIELRRQAVETLRTRKAGPAAIDWHTHDAIVERTTDLARLKALVGQRFQIPVAEIGALERGQATAGGAQVEEPADWTVAGLKRAYNVLKALPVTHTEANQRFAALRRYEGTGGWYREKENKVAVGTPLDTQLDYRLPDDGTHGLRGGTRLVDWTLRHEIGHAVYENSAQAQGHTASDQGGHWETAFDVVMSQVIDESNGPLRQVLARASGNTGEQIIGLLHTAFREPGLANFYAGMIALKHNEDGQVPVSDHVTKERLLEDDAWTLFAQDLESTWRSGTLHQLGGRAFVKSADRGLSSFDPAAHGRKVTNYQFRSASEWFAEAYAAYHEPSVLPGTLLARAGDQATADLISTL